MRSGKALGAVAGATLASLVLLSSPASAVGGGHHSEGKGKPQGGSGQGGISASIKNSQIKVTQSGGGKVSGKGNLAPVDPNWKPPVCWYEPVATPKQLKDFVEKSGDGDVGILESWYGKGLWTDYYRDGKSQTEIAPGTSHNRKVKGYKNYNLGKKGQFWRSVAPDDSAPGAEKCSRIMFWQDAGKPPDDPHAPTAKTLADYAYNKIKLPKTKVELKPKDKSTVNLPTWTWLDKGEFKPVKVRAELPHTGLWAETTAKPVSLHLDPGTDEADTFPAGGECEIGKDGGIGRPYKQGDAGRKPPCGVTYLHSTNGEPYALKASVTWKVSWRGSDDDATHHLPDGTFGSTQRVNVVERQTIN